MILLDSSILIDLFRKKKKENSQFYKLLDKDSEFGISVITYYEIGIGNNSFSSVFFKELYESLTIFPLDKPCSETAIKIYLSLKKQNKLIDLADLLMGATAVTHQLPIATLNRKHFERLPGIEIV